MTWRRHGIIFPSTRAQLPVISAISDGFRCYYSTRLDGRSVGNYFDFQISKRDKRIQIFSQANNLLMPGTAGAVDSAGCMPMQFCGDLLYYIGWTLRVDVPYFNYTCVARINNDGSIKKLGPILSPDTVDDGFSGTLFSMPDPADDNHFIGYYLSADSWLEDENNALQPTYNLKICRSKDGIKWKKTGDVAISKEAREAGISAASIIKASGAYHMWFSVREGVNFRGGEGAYAIKHASSLDGINWFRDDKYSLASDKLYGENMCAYPSIIKFQDTIYMFYNGLNFGEGGISLATISVSSIS